MAVAPSRTKVTREEVYEYLQDFDGQKKHTKKLRDHLAKKMKDKDHDPEQKVDTTANDSLPDETSLVDMILLDIESYG
jgi:sRNA-binding carbon storage regulator CsrA